jgi:hypothetical protein
VYLLRVINEPLYQHFVRAEVDFIHFGFRWLVCLLVREFPLQMVCRIWDEMFAHFEQMEPVAWVCYLAAALLDRFSERLMKLHSFDEILMFLQHPPSQEYTMEQTNALIEHTRHLIKKEQVVTRFVVLLVSLCTLISISVHSDLTIK